MKAIKKEVDLVEFLNYVKRVFYIKEGRKRIRVLFRGGLSREAVRIGGTLTAYLHGGTEKR